MSYLDINEAISENSASTENEEIIESENSGQETESQEELTEETTEDKKEETQEQKFDGYEIKHNGKQVKITPDKVQQFLQKGYDYNFKMRDLNIERQKFIEERNSFKAEAEENNKRYGELKELDDYARQNPEWLNKVKTMYENEKYGREEALKNIDPENPIFGVVETQNKQIDELKQMLKGFVDEREMVKKAEEDAQLDGTVLDIKNQYKDFDWEKIDANGQSLEQKVLQHALDNDISNFKTAFVDLMHDEIVKREVLKQKENLGKQISQTKKLGLGKKTDEPIMGLKRATNTKSKSYQELMREGLEELGLKL